jgi:hypothetical protein
VKERRLFCHKEAIFQNNISFFLRERGHGQTFLAKPVTMELQEESDCHASMPEPTFVLRPEEAQALMDSLWTCGLRPSEGSGSAGAMAATQKHLEDMRTLVFKPVSQ